MSLTVAETGGGDFELAPEGTHVARCYQVIDVGTQETPWGDKPKIIIKWELPYELRSEDKQPFMVSTMYTASLSEKANLRHDLEAWRGKNFTEEELAGFNLSKLLGQYCMLQVVHNRNEKNGKTYANVKSVMALPKGSEKPEGVNPTLFLDLDNFDQSVFDQLSDGMKDLIRKSKDWSDQNQPAETATAGGGGEEWDQDFEDDIPFASASPAFDWPKSYL
jgi:hypothetical protein